MSQQPASTPRPDHPVEAFLCAALDSLGALADAPVWTMDEQTTDRVVVLAARVAAGVAELEARAINRATELDRPGAARCRGVKQWLRLTTNVTHRSAARKAELASAVSRWEATRLAMAVGALHAEQAAAVSATIGLLDDDVSAHDRRRAEAFLLGLASDHDADALGRLGHEIYQRLDPEGADARESRALERQEARAAARTRLTLHDDGTGLTHGRFTIPVAEGAMLRKALTALAAPKAVRAQHGADSYDWQRPTPARLGQAFCSLIARFPTARLPRVGGLHATVVAVGDADLLAGRVKAARLDTGIPISHTAWLRLACEAGIVPLWMSGSGEVLSIGRRHRFHTARQRLALIATRRHCESTGCDVAGYLCHVHHPHPWADGGPTDLANAELLCPFHHSRAHEGPGEHPLRT